MLGPVVLSPTTLPRLDNDNDIADPAVAVGRMFAPKVPRIVHMHAGRHARAGAVVVSASSDKKSPTKIAKLTHSNVRRMKRKFLHSNFV
jgi:hypothetical protein